jgi:hypothetical protein
MCTSGEKYTVSSTGPLKCFKADLTKSSGSSALISATSSSSYDGKDVMAKRCCGMTDYYAVTGQTFDAGDLASSSSCAAPAAPTNGNYPVDSACASGKTLLSGYQCTASCSAGYCSSGSTKCVKGKIVETSTCVKSDKECEYTAAKAEAQAESGTEGSAASLRIGVTSLIIAAASVFFLPL